MSDTQETPAQNPVSPEADSEQETTSANSSSLPIFTIYVCAAIGGTIAAIADIVQKEQASAVMKMTTVSARHLNLAVPPLYVFAIVVFLGVLLCFVFQPNSRRAGFAVGAGVIATIMTVTPYQPLQTGQPTDGETPGESDTSSLSTLGNRTIQLASSNFGQTLFAMNLADIAVIPIKNDLAVPVEVKVSFYDRNSRQPFEQVIAIAAGQTGTFEFAAMPDQGRINAEFYIQVGGESSSYMSVSGQTPYQNDTLLLTEAVPAFAQAQINEEALQSFSTTSDTRAPRIASDSEVREIYNKPTGFFNQLQQKLLTPRKW